MSGYTQEYIQEKLTKELEATHVGVEDQSDGCGAKFSVVVVSPKFTGKPLLQRHRLVNGVLQEELKTIHAFSMKTLTPEQWEEQQK
ncbi:bolA-like protein 2 isoform X4 [Homarus americanus]|uniref:bolA-like protein 2 isoform X4 n=1 Tax=Homarus americanus TaxID=6706 RepID=UPI001C46991F|nr:bolA-like protein 2 isoform X4 [Homarus americanus]